MKKILSSIERGLKRLSLRELSPKNLEKTIKGCKEESIDGNTRKVTEYFIKDEKPIIVISEDSLKETSDYSHPHIKHTGFYNDRTRSYMYNEEGQLVEKSVNYGPHSIYTFSKNKVLKFDPPGSWIEQKLL